MSSAFEGLPKTPNLELNKPGYDNVADIEALNENADILDAEIQGIKNTFVKSVNGINAGDGGNVDLGIIPIAKGGTGASTAEQARTNLGLGNVATLNTVPIVNGGTGATTVASARNALGLGNTNGAVPIANGGTGATTASQARTNLGLATVANTGSYNDLSNKPAIPSAYITKTYVNGTSWYRKYSNGWIEQGGVIAADNSQVTLVTPMQNTNYRVLVSFEETTSSTTVSYGYQSANSKTTTGFTFGKSAGAKRYWRAEG